MINNNLEFPNKLSDLEQRLRSQLDPQTFNQVATIILRLQPVPDDKLLIGHNEIANFTGLSIHQVKRISRTLQDLHIAFKIRVHDGNQRRAKVCAYKAHLMDFMQRHSASSKDILRKMRRISRYGKCPHCGERIQMK